VIIASEEAVRKHNLTPLARLVGYGIAGVEPTIMGIGPVPAIQKVLGKAGLGLEDIDLIEVLANHSFLSSECSCPNAFPSLQINEAFAAQTLACQKELGIELGKLNVNGGAIALGHPLAASGSRITAHLVHELRRQKKKYGLGSACIGGGQGIALLIESL
jgi:acetyl-CoA acyltransferase 2